MSQLTTLDPWETPRPKLHSEGGLKMWSYHYILGWCALHSLDPTKPFNAKDVPPIIKQAYGEHVEPRTIAGLLKKLEVRGFITRTRLLPSGKTQYVYHFTPPFLTFTRRRNHQ